MPKILVVDDEEDQEALIIQRVVGRDYVKGYDFLFSRSGHDALQKINDYPDIDLALLDINMPELDGLSLLALANEINPRMKTIIISAYGDIHNIRAAMNNGAFDFLTKPIEINDLKKTIEKVLKHIDLLKEKKRIEEELKQLKIRSIELEMQALRAQMNPHFIFNALNSINNFIQQKDETQASDFLIKFSKLIRAVLEYSTLPLISLGQEMEVLRLYIGLESLRFKYKFVHTFLFADELDLDSIKLPPLLLQPFVENAIYHGLLPKNSPGSLSIDLQEYQKTIRISIKDDGIGRKASFLKKSGANINHEPKGINISCERIKIFNGKTSDENLIEIIDLEDQNRISTGTEVIINLPIVV